MNKNTFLIVNVLEECAQVFLRFKDIKVIIYFPLMRLPQLLSAGRPKS